MAPRRSGAVLDQLPQARRAAVGGPSGDLQPGTQRKQAASSGSARQALESVVPAQGVTPLSSSRPRLTLAVGTRCGTSFFTECVQRNKDQQGLTVAPPNFTLPYDADLSAA